MYLRSVQFVHFLQSYDYFAIRVSIGMLDLYCSFFTPNEISCKYTLDPFFIVYQIWCGLNDLNESPEIIHSTSDESGKDIFLVHVLYYISFFSRLFCIADSVIITSQFKNCENNCNYFFYCINVYTTDFVISTFIKNITILLN